MPYNAPAGLAVSIYQSNSHKIIAYGTWSNHNNSPGSTVNGVKLSDECAAVNVQKVVVPAAVLTQHKCSLSTLGPPPFTVVCMRNQVHISHFEDIGSNIRDSGSSLAKELQVVEASEVEVESSEVFDDSWLEDIEEQGDDAGNDRNAIPDGCDKESLENALRVLHELSKGKGKVALPTRVIKDIWHAFHMISIS